MQGEASKVKLFVSHISFQEHLKVIYTKVIIGIKKIGHCEAWRSMSIFAIILKNDLIMIQELRSEHSSLY